MTEVEIIIANLKAQITIEKAHIVAMGGYVYNTDFQLQCNVRRKVVERLEEAIRELKK